MILLASQRYGGIAPVKVNHILACIKRSVTIRLKKVILSLCSTLVRAHLEYCIWLWSPQHRKDMDLLERSSGAPQK